MAVKVGQASLPVRPGSEIAQKAAQAGSPLYYSVRMPELLSLAPASEFGFIPPQQREGRDYGGSDRSADQGSQLDKLLPGQSQRVLWRSVRVIRLHLRMGTIQS